tara:strand:+ start:167 stop:451 length:285 start_codon:yes stop_codon:yes gene_type:complete
MHNSDKKFRLTITILAILLVLSVGYIAIDKYTTSREQQLMATYQGGYNKGVQDAVVSLYQQTNNCQPATINIGNLTKQIFDVACLQNQQAGMQG